MLTEALPRLVIRLRSALPDAAVELKGSSAARVVFDSSHPWEMTISLHKVHEQFQITQTCLLLRQDALKSLSSHELNRLIAFENQGLRGVTLSRDEHDSHAIRIRASFIGQKGRTRDESENLLIDVLSLLRFARILEDRIERSSVAGEFCLEMYQSLYSAHGRGRNRYINYARNVFQGSTERVFGQVASMLREDYKYKVQITGPNVAKIVHADHPTVHSLETVMRVPEEVPMVTCFAPLMRVEHDPGSAAALLAELNTSMGRQCDGGHFELDTSGTLISFVAWKHLTNDLRYYSLDHMISSVNRASELLQVRLLHSRQGESQANFATLRKAA